MKVLFTHMNAPQCFCLFLDKMPQVIVMIISFIMICFVDHLLPYVLRLTNYYKRQAKCWALICGERNSKLKPHRMRIDAIINLQHERWFTKRSISSMINDVF